MGCGDEMSRIIVVGASGYLGGRIARYLQQIGNEVIGTYRNPPHDPENLLGSLYLSIQGDVTGHQFIEDIVATQPEYLIYLVSLNHRSAEKDYQHSININVAPLLTLGRKLATLGGFRRLIYMSTQQVYGQLPAEKIRLTPTHTDPDSMYGWTHSTCEDGLRFLNRKHQLNSVSLRLSNGYGAPAFPFCDCWWLVVNDFCLSALRNGSIRLLSDGSARRDFIHVDDIARGISKLVKHNEEFPRVMNLNSGEPLSILGLAHRVASVFESDFGKKVPVVFPDGSISTDFEKIRGRCGSAQEKSDSLASVQLPVSLDFGIREVIEYILKYDLHDAVAR